MNCPNCKLKLQRIQYEGLNIRQCDACRGHLVSLSRLKSIQARRRNSEEDLLEEVVNEGEDSLGKIRCSQCIGRMEKRKRRIGTLEFFIDLCRKCDLVWLDEGELAKLQVIFEFSEKGEEAERFRLRLANMSPEEKADYEERIANLPETSLSQEIAVGLLFEFYLGRHRL